MALPALAFASLALASISCRVVFLEFDIVRIVCKSFVVAELMVCFALASIGVANSTCCAFGKMPLFSSCLCLIIASTFDFVHRHV